MKIDHFVDFFFRTIQKVYKKLLAYNVSVFPSPAHSVGMTVPDHYLFESNELLFIQT